MPDRVSRPQSPQYQLFMLVLCLATLFSVGVQALTSPATEVRRVLQAADNVACLLFFVDFVVTLRRAPDKWRYLYTWGWLDLLSSIPVLDAARWGRAARVARLLRLLRGVRATVEIADVLLARRKKSTVLALSLMLLLLLVTSSVLVLLAETAETSNIRTAEDALWWSITTITTVGYGDRFPVTTEGRAVATALMAAGVGLFGVLSGLIAAWFIEGERTAEPRDDAMAEVRALAEEIRQLRAALDGRPSS